MKKPRRKRSREDGRTAKRFRKALGLALKKLRLRLKITQQAASEKVGLSGSSAIANVERGTNSPTLLGLFRLSKVYKFSIDALFDALKIKE